jgi:hypothetical protein
MISASLDHGNGNRDTATPGMTVSPVNVQQTLDV